MQKSLLSDNLQALCRRFN